MKEHNNNNVRIAVTGYITKGSSKRGITEDSHPKFAKETKLSLILGSTSRRPAKNKGCGNALGINIKDFRCYHWIAGEKRGIQGSQSLLLSKAGVCRPTTLPEPQTSGTNRGFLQLRVL